MPIVARTLDVTLRAACLAVVGSLAALALAPASATATPDVGRSRAAQPALVAVWHMDETSGTTMVDAVGGHSGTIVGAQVGVPGFSGSAYLFGGRSFVSVPNAAALNPGRKRIALKIRLNTTLVPPRPDWDIMRKGVFGNGTGDYKLEFQPTGQATCGFLGSLDDAEITAGPPLNDGRWHTVQCVKTNASIRLVVGGRRFSKRVRVGSIRNGAPLVIGARPGSEFFQGALDEASVVVG